MDEPYAELIFDAVILLATAFALAAYMLGVLLEPMPAIGVSFALVVGGAWLVIPAGGRILAGIGGLIAVLLAGIVVPRTVVELTGVSDELPIVLSVSGVVVLLVFAVLHLTTFRRQPAPTT